ncbi:unnamed protein product, partial [Didymodactylos carnosus]
ETRTIHPTATWSENATTVAGGNGQGEALNKLAFPRSIFMDDHNNVYVADSRYSSDSTISKCISKERLLDGHVDCINAADETTLAVDLCQKSLSNRFQSANGINDCVDEIDEKMNGYCRTHYPYENGKRFRCSNSSLCITVAQLCDCESDCPLGDDEELLCHWLNEYLCKRKKYVFWCENGKGLDCSASRCSGYDECSSGEDEWFCDISDLDSVVELKYYFLYLQEYPTQLYNVQPERRQFSAMTLEQDQRYKN